MAETDGKRGARGAARIAILLLTAAGVGLLLWSKTKAPPGSVASDEGEAALGTTELRAEGEAPSTAAEAAIEGQVLDPDGRPLEGATVAALRQRDRDEAMASGSGLLPRIARSGADGRFRIDGIGAGRYTVAATAPGLTSTFVGGVRVAGSKTTTGVELHLRRDGVTLSGRVLDTGGGTIPGARVRASHFMGQPGPDKMPEVAAFETLADSRGAYQLQVPKGRLSVTAQFEGYTIAREFFELTTDTTKDFRLEPAARISGRVITAEGHTPVAGAEVSAEPAERQFSLMFEPVTTDEQGVFRFTSLAAGSYRLSARKGGLVGALSNPVPVTVAAPADNIEVAVAAGLTVEGTIKSHVGKAITGARVAIFPDKPMGGPSRNEQGKSDANGRYRVEGLQPGAYRIYVSADGHSGTGAEVALSASLTRDFTLEDGVVVKGIVLTSAGQPATGAELEARARPLARGAMSGSDRATADAEGRFEFKRLVPGEVTLSVKHAMETATVGPENIAPGEHKELTIKLAAGARVSGTISWDDGEAAAKIKIVGTGRGGGNLRVDGESGVDGSFTVGPFPPGEISVVAMPPGERINWSSQARPEQADLKVVAGEHRTGVKLVASRRNGSIKGVVIGPDGKPVDGASVRAGLERAGRASRGSIGEGRATSGVDGTFAIDGLTKGTFTLWASHGTLADAERMGVAVGASDVKLQLRAAASIVGVAVDGAGKPLSSYSLAVVAVKAGETEAVRLRRASGFETSPLRVNDPRGSFRTERLAAGIYDLVATAVDGTVARASGIAVAEGESKQGVRLVAEAGVTVAGRVIEYESGQPIAGVQVRVRGPNGQGPEATSDATGAFTVTNVPRLPGLFATLEPTTRTHVSESPPLPPVRDGRIDLGTIRMLKADPKNPNRGRVGIMFYEEDGKILIGDVNPGSPGAKAGILKGDIVLSVDGRKEIDLAEVTRGMRGDPDKVTTMIVQTPGQPPRELKVKRAM